MRDNDELTGLRVLVGKGGGLVYGVAWVRYNEGHEHAGEGRAGDAYVHGGFLPGDS